jgi:hypothetical protein
MARPGIVVAVAAIDDETGSEHLPDLQQREYSRVLMGNSEGDPTLCVVPGVTIAPEATKERAEGVVPRAVKHP